MSNNGTDRDVALLIADAFSAIQTAIQTINNNLYVPHITEQPTDVTAAVGASVTFDVTANNVKSYRWQYKSSEESETWLNASAESTTSSYTFTMASNRYAWRFRCQITGLNNDVIYTDTVKVIQPE